MRLASLSLVLATTLCATSLASQPVASTLHPLPAILAPRQQTHAEAPSMKQIELGAITGMVVGMTVGGLYGAFFADECGVEDDCDLSREVKTVGFVAIGGGLGGIIGLGTSYVLGFRAARPESAPLRISPAADGGLSVDMSLRH